MKNGHITNSTTATANVAAADPLMLFLHIPKTGGRSVREFMARQLSAHQILDINPPAGAEDQEKLKQQGIDAIGSLGYKTLQQNDIEQFRSFASQPYSRLVAGHFRFGIHLYTDRRCIYFTFVRRPETFIPSLYYEMKRSVYDFDLDLINRFQHIEDFAERVHDVQTFILSGLDKYSDMLNNPQEALALARHNVATYFSFAGTLENIDACIDVVAKKFLRKKRGHLKHINKSDHAQKGLEDALMKHIRGQNSLDTELYFYIAEKYKDEFNILKKKKPFFIR